MLKRLFILLCVALVGVGAVVLFAVVNDRIDSEAPVATVVDQETPNDHVEAIVSSHELATEAGFEVLAMGGTAADAAVAVAATLSVVEPWFSSVLGGGTWALYYDASQERVTSLDGVGPTGSLASVADYAERAGEPGMHQAIVPGAWDGWMVWLREYGELDLGDVLAPAIRIAREGHPASEGMVEWLSRQRSQTFARPATAEIYFPGGTMLSAGETVYQHDMAETFESLVRAYDAARGEGREVAIQAARDHFYRGPIAESIVAFSEQQSGYLIRSDFENFATDLVEPISIEYGDDITVYQNPPNSQGITMLIGLGILDGYNLSQYASLSADSIHLMAEAIKLAFTDRHFHVGDPARVSVPVEGLLSDTHAAQQRARIDMNQAMTWPIADGFEPLDPDLGNTTTFHVTDRFGNGAAVTTSLGAQFFVVPNTGIHINHRMRFLAIDDGPNQVAPGFKVRHTSNPYMAFRDGRLSILGGNTGADSQSQGQIQQFVGVVHQGLSAQEAVARPRFISTAFPSTVYSYQIRNTLQLEEGHPDEVIANLRDRGHDVTIGDGTWGSANMIVLIDEGRDADMGVDPRTEVSYAKKDWADEG